MATNLFPPSPNQGIPQSPVADTASVASSANIPATQILLERSEIDKSLKSLESLVSLLYDHAQLWQNLVALDKKLVKAFKDASGMKRVDAIEWPCNVLSTSSLIFDSVSDVDSKYSKLVEREYETCAQEFKKWTKKLKEYKALEEYTSAANAKIKAAGLAYEKKSKKGIASSPSGQSLDSYSALLSTLSSSVANAKHQHTLFTSDRHVNALYTISGSVGRVADAQWMKTCDLLRRCAGNVGPLGEGRSYVEGGWKGGMVQELPVNLPVQKSGETTIQPVGLTTARTDETETPTIKPPSNKTPTSVPIAELTSPPAITSTPSLEGKSRSSHSDVLEQIAEELKNSTIPPKDAKKEIQQKSGDATDKKRSDSETPKTKGDVKESPKPPQTTPVSQRETAPTTISSGTTNTNRSDLTMSSNMTSAKDTSTEESYSKDSSQALNASTAPKRITPKDSTSLDAHNALTNPPVEKRTNEIAMPRPILARSDGNEVRDNPPSAHLPRFPESGVSSPPSHQTPYNPILSSPTPIFAAHSTTGQGMTPAPQPLQPNPPPAYPRKPAGRTMSMDSTGSASGIVSALRERYTSPPPQAMAAPRESLPPRDGAAGRVSDMASRFTPIDRPADMASFGYSGDGRYPRLASPPLNRGLTNQSHDSLPIRTPLGRSSIDEFGKPMDLGRRGQDTTPNPELRRPPLMSSTLGSGAIGNSQTEYDIRLSELELQQRELELHRNRLQLAKEREALLARDRDAQDSMHDSDYSSGREGGSFRGGWGTAAQPRGELYDGGRYGSRQGRYDNPQGRDAYVPSYGYNQSRREEQDHPYNQPPGTPRIGEGNDFNPYGEGRYIGSPRIPGSHTPTIGDLSSIGQGVMGLGPPPGAARPDMYSRSRESLMDTSQKPQQLSPPIPHTSSGATRSREPSPRRSADSVPSNTGRRSNEKEKGGTWIGKGLKRLSMPLGSNNGH